MLQPDHPALREIVEHAPLHYWRDFALIAGEVREEPHLSWFRCGRPIPFFNRVTWTRLMPEQADEVIAATLDDFRAAGTPFRWYVNDDTRPGDLAERLTAHGFVEAGATIPMLLDLTRLERPSLAPGVTVKRVVDAADRDAFGRVLDATFLPNDLSRPFHTMEHAFSDALYEAKPRFLARVDGEPAATSVLVEADGVAGIYAVATLPAFRNRGLGALMTLAPLVEARDRGVRHGILHASAMGEPVYRRIGFKPIGRHRIFEAPD